MENIRTGILFVIIAVLVAVAMFLASYWSTRNLQTARTIAERQIEQAPVVTTSGYTCPQPQPRVEITSKEVNLFVWSEFIPVDMVECFEKVYGVKVNLVEFGTYEEEMAGIEQQKVAYDIVQISDQGVPEAISNGNLAALDKSRLTVLDNFNPNYLNLPFDPGNNYTLPYLAGSTAIAVNTKTVKNIPKAWADLWKPEYAGRMTFPADSRGTIGITLLTMGYDINSLSPEYVDEVKAKVKELLKAIKVIENDSPSSILLQGEADLGLMWNGEALLAQRQNPAIQYIYPEEGTILWQENYAIHAHALHLDTAYAWLNYTLQGDIFWMNLRDFPYIIPNSAALKFSKENHPELHEAYIASTITNMPSEVVAKGSWVENMGESNQLYDDLWAEVLTESGD